MTKNTSASSGASIAHERKSTALVISPTFFDYYKSIISEFEGLGFDTYWMNTWLYKNPIYKICLRIAPHVVARLSTNQYIRQIEKLGLSDLSEILVIKGEGLSPEFLQHLRHKFPEANLSLYLWDGVANTRGAVEIAPAFDSVSTFDPKDSKSFNWLYRPLFARRINQETAEATKTYTYDWVFIGSIHSDRFSVLRRLAQSRQAHNFYAFGFMPGKIMWILRHLTDLKLWRPGRIKLSTKSIAPELVNEIIKSSRAVVDIEHPKQCGLTMRSIETLLLGRKLVTTNQEIISSDLFHETRVCVIDRNRPEIPSSFLVSTFLAIPPDIRSKYQLRTWLSDVIKPKSQEHSNHFA